MYLILYNPISRNGQKINKLIKKLNKTKEEVIAKNLLEIENVSEFTKNVRPQTKVVIVGGDGTLNRIANCIYGRKDIDIYLYKGGTGNDFRRSIKSRKKLVKINEYIKKLPKITANQKTMYFLNGAGIGIDGLISEKVNLSRDNKSKSNFFKATMQAFKEYKPIDLNLEVDDKKYSFKNCYLATVLNGVYLGGGMKFSPKSNRLDDKLEVLVLNNISKHKLIFLFPTIYFGQHIKIKKYVTYLSGRNIKASFEKPSIMQVDGDHFYDILNIQVTI